MTPQAQKRRAARKKPRPKGRSTFSIEWGLKNYLNKHNIYRDDSDMQTIIINSFYNDYSFEGTNEDPWKEKILFTQEHFGKFAQYAQNNWKEKQNHEK